MGSSTLHKLSIICLISATVPSSFALATAVSAARAVGLIPREAACGGVSGLQQCGQGFPSDFCCPTSSTCLPLNNTVTASVICCPAGQDCKFIQPITCDASQLNATLHPENQIHAANLNGVQLPTCGSSCCPLGYTCSGGMCTLTSPSSTSSSPSPTAATTNTALPASSQTSASTPPIPTAGHSNPAFPAKAVVAGFFPGLILGVLLTLATIWLIKKRREYLRNRYSGDFGHVARTVSDPIYDPQYAARTDFLRRGSGSGTSNAHSSPSSTTQMVARNNTIMRHNNANMTVDTAQPARVRSLFSRSPTMTSVPVPAAVRPRDPYATPTRTPTRSSTRTSARGSTRTHSRPHTATTTTTRSTRKSMPVRTDSQETIDVLMPAPSFLQPPPMPERPERPLTGATTFTALMEHAGFSQEDRERVKRPAAPSPRTHMI
ncbi:hypothetical protein AOQ84DRAFT_179922 [Glonium stellatum]|uniref:Uncharacterized protein n=1 Tax=Glonium stellatum TaxID=574774 RepID=A0A8E2JM75_9PEZI|nr:hypothetical protein AOQ84DRAFT_179922 [Glonium stellatum]